MERQVGEFGAKAFKFYNVRYDYGSPYPWRMDDPQVAFPIFEKAQRARRQPDRGAQGRAARPAADRGTPRPGTWTARRPTSRTSTSSSSTSGCRSSTRRAGSSSGTRTCTPRWPRPSTSSSARRGCSPRSSASCCSGAARTRSSTAPRRRSGTRSGRCEAFMDFQIPQDLCDGYGYPQLTDQAKRKILGENLLRLHGMDVQEARVPTSATTVLTGIWYGGAFRQRLILRTGCGWPGSARRRSRPARRPR